MKHLKKIENYKTDLYSNYPDVGDYVIMNTTNKGAELKEFINNNIGVATSVGANTLRVSYEKIPNSIIIHFHRDDDGRLFSVEMIEDVVDFSKDRSELEAKISANKYNL
jgi:hypothetical protein